MFPVHFNLFFHMIYSILYISLQFYLQDTKSSNGTFINSQRLSRGSEESPPCEILSGDIIQFGVDVTENTRKGKGTDHFYTFKFVEYFLHIHESWRGIAFVLERYCNPFLKRSFSWSKADIPLCVQTNYYCFLTCCEPPSIC